MKIWNGSIAQKARKLSIVDKNESVIVGSPILSQSEQHEAGELVSQLLRLLVSLPEKLGLNYFEYATNQLGITKDAAEIILCSNETLSENIFARADIVRSKGKWQLLEMNVGSSVGGMFYSSLPRLTGLDQKHDVLKEWGQIIYNNYCQGVRHIAFVEDPSYIEDLRTQFDMLATELSTQQPGLKCSILSPGEIWVKDNQLQSKNGHIDCVYRFFNEQDVVKNPQLYSHIINAIKTGSVSVPMGFSSQLLSNKGTLAFLHELIKSSLLSEDEVKLVELFIPYTCRINHPNLKMLLADPINWVIKPTDSACGDGVVYGGEVSSSEWKSLLDGIINNTSVSYIAQKYCKAEYEPVVFNTSENKNIETNASVLWGIYVFGSRYLGTLVRANPHDNTIIINHAVGASVGPLSYKATFNISNTNSGHLTTSIM